jgi:hypothetical protein
LIIFEKIEELTKKKNRGLSNTVENNGVIALKKNVNARFFLND